MSGSKLLAEGNLSKIFVLGSSFDFMSKIGYFFGIFTTLNFYIT